MNNKTLQKDLEGFLANPKIMVTKGNISGNSIEVTDKETQEDLGSFTYYDEQTKRDIDYNEITNLISDRNV